MQRVYEVKLSPEDYQQQDAGAKVEPEAQCPSCLKKARLHRHGFYFRAVTSSKGIVLLIRVARFLCSLCRRTISYLPDFALSYRLVNARTVDRFLKGDHQSPDVQRCHDRLLSYRASMCAFLPTLIRRVGRAFDWIPKALDPCWAGMMRACGSLATATRQRVSRLGVTLFAQYSCHQSASTPKFISS
jgi:hypothetical protein